MTVDATLTLESAAARAWDVIVVGAGPAGSMAARELARRGVAVLLVDKSAFPRWKACGCCLNAWGQAVLQHAGLGDLPERLGGVPLTRFLLSIFERRVELSLPHSLAISREALDAALVREAIAAGAHFLPEAPAQLGALTPEQRRLTLRRGHIAVEVGAGLVLAADGLSGRLVAAEPEGELDIDPDSRLGAGAMLEAEAPFYERGVIYMGCGERGYVGLVRVEDGRLNIGAALDPEAVRERGGLGAVITATLEESGLPPVAGLEQFPWRGTPLLTRRIKALAGRRWMALGDAAGYVEPFTGEGMSWALAQGRAIAPLAADAARTWSPERGLAWGESYRRLMGERQHRCRAIANALRHPVWAGWLLGALTIVPWVADPVVRRFTMPAPED